MSKFLNARLTRWILAIQDYNIKVEHLPGKDNVMVDVLSRLHEENSYKRNRGATRIIINALNYNWIQEMEQLIREIPAKQREDKKLKLFKQEIESEPERRARFKIINDNIYHFDGTTCRILITKEILQNLIWECHAAYGHPGAEKT
ncbi:uncharacterized protein LOC117181303 [Belonocnema kinseyi]|uniref:uncharacterized protein LOC117181303 n=1 Tax=Belonocnema kinseyi TaxID=2817044 RepID=UPI00143DAE2C|nr:uncharacterized protein LOC117181303 [Belonocnema kinseyi]